MSRVRSLLEAKERYGFKFIRRESSNFEHPHPLQLSSDDSVMTSVAGLIRGRLNQGSAQVFDNVAALCDQLEQTQQLLRDTRAIEGARNTRTACFEQLKRLASAAQISAEMHVVGILDCPWHFSPARGFYQKFAGSRRLSAFFR